MNDGTNPSPRMNPTTRRTNEFQLGANRPRRVLEAARADAAAAGLPTVRLPRRQP
jgi:hypothetical protein